VTAAEPNSEQNANKESGPVFPEGNGNGKPEAKAQDSGATDRSKQQSSGNGRATQAQVRALFALSRKANYHDDDVAQMLAPFEVSHFEDLPREAASQLIGAMQQEVAA
jgi:hypothetical protein